MRMLLSECSTLARNPMAAGVPLLVGFLGSLLFPCMTRYLSGENS
jgi:hypothetical protein